MHTGHLLSTPAVVADQSNPSARSPRRMSDFIVRNFGATQVPVVRTRYNTTYRRKNGTFTSERTLTRGSSASDRHAEDAPWISSPFIRSVQSIETRYSTGWPVHDGARVLAGGGEVAFAPLSVCCVVPNLAFSHPTSESVLLSHLRFRPNARSFTISSNRSYLSAESGTKKGAPCLALGQKSCLKGHDTPQAHDRQKSATI